MKAFLVDVEFDWGFQARVVGLSKTSPSYDYPPPTTFLGALSESLSRRHLLGEDTKISNALLRALASDTLALGVRPLNCRPLKYSDVNRIIAYKITKGVHYPTSKNLAGSFDAPSRGKTLLATLEPGEPPKLRWFIVFEEGRIRVSGREIEVTADDFWRIHRIGSKESRVSVCNVEDISARVEVRSGEEQRTNYSFPVVEGVTPKGEIGGRWVYNVYVDPWRLSELEGSILRAYYEKKALAPYKLPIMAYASDRPSHVVELGGWMRLYTFGRGGEAVVGRSSRMKESKVA